MIGGNLFHASHRFYSRLPEVRKKMEEEKRSQDYSANREKARVYQEVRHVRMPHKTQTSFYSCVRIHSH